MNRQHFGLKISVILLDWGVRESFHAIEYLNNQTGIKRDEYELVWVEYFCRRVPDLVEAKKNGKIDNYLVLGNMPGFYKKHVGWNEGVAVSKGEVVVLCDSDAIFPSNFLKEIVCFFDENIDSFLHIDEIRSNNRNLWPFDYTCGKSCRRR